jgi:hypothetical protein
MFFCLFVLLISVLYVCYVLFCSLRLFCSFLFVTFILFISVLYVCSVHSVLFVCSFLFFIVCLFSSLLYVCSSLLCSLRLSLHKIQLIESRSKKSSKQSRNEKRKFHYFCSAFIFTQFKQDVIHLNFLHFLFKKLQHCRFTSIKL